MSCRGAAGVLLACGCRFLPWGSRSGETVVSGAVLTKVGVSGASLFVVSPCYEILAFSFNTFSMLQLRVLASTGFVRGSGKNLCAIVFGFESVALYGVLSATLGGHSFRHGFLCVSLACPHRLFVI